MGIERLSAPRLQLAKAFGATVFTPTAAGKCAACERLAAIRQNYVAGFRRRVKEKRVVGVDLILDMVAGDFPRHC